MEVDGVGSIWAWAHGNGILARQRRAAIRVVLMECHAKLPQGNHKPQLALGMGTALFRLDPEHGKLSAVGEERISHSGRCVGEQIRAHILLKLRSRHLCAYKTSEFDSHGVISANTRVPALPWLKPIPLKGLTALPKASLASFDTKRLNTSTPNSPTGDEDGVSDVSASTGMAEASPMMMASLPASLLGRDMIRFTFIMVCESELKTANPDENS